MIHCPFNDAKASLKKRQHILLVHSNNLLSGTLLQYSLCISLSKSACPFGKFANHFFYLYSYLRDLVFSILLITTNRSCYGINKIRFIPYYYILAGKKLKIVDECGWVSKLFYRLLTGIYNYFGSLLLFILQRESQWPLNNNLKSFN